MANRVANSADVITYAVTTRNQLQVGDVILDTATSTANGKNGIFYTDIATRFSTARTGFTVWISSSLTPMYALSFSNNGTLWSGKSTVSSPITFRPLGGQIRIIGEPIATTAKRLSFNDMEYVDVVGELDAYPGMKYNWSGFLPGTFGLYIDNSDSYDQQAQMIEAESNAGVKGIRMRGVEIAGGFSDFRCMFANSAAKLEYLTLHRNLFHSGYSEGVYIGMTSGSPRPEFGMLSIVDCIFACRGTEEVQVQNLVKSSTKAYIKNIIMYAADGAWKAPFSGAAGQDNGVQWLVEEGDNIFEKFILDGCAFTGFHIHGYAQGTPDARRAVVRNGLIQDSRNISFYLNVDNAQGCGKEIRDMFLRKYNQTYTELVGSSTNYAFSSNNGSATDTVLINRLTWDKGTKTTLFQSQSTNYQIPAGASVAVVEDPTLVEPSYFNHGFPNKNAEQIEIWFQNYGVGPNIGTPITYNAGDIVMNFVIGVLPVYYHCKSTHSSTAGTKPNLDATHWDPIVWDANGKPSYDPSYNGVPFNYHPPLDFRLTADSYWNKKGYGLRMNMRNTDHTTFQWYIADDAVGTNSKELAGEVEKTMTKYPEDVGKYVRCLAYWKISTGITQQWLGGWTQLT
jgi:hypothetical protein